MGQYGTPLRYPGGKQRLTPFISELLESNDLLGGEYVEPYAGGAGVAIELLLGRQVRRVHLNDSSYPIYAFWKSVVDNPEAFCRRISSTSLTIDEWKGHREVLRHPQSVSMAELGFSTFYLNRCNRSGVLSGGVIGGLAQTGKWLIDARFPRNELIRRVESIGLFKDRITVTNLDAEKYLSEKVSQLPLDVLVYCDPPYYEKSSRLYLDHYKPSDHGRLAELIQNTVNHKWIVSYDSAYEIMSLYGERRSFTYDLQYSAARSYKGREVFIFSDDVTLPANSAMECIEKALPSVTRSATHNR